MNLGKITLIKKYIVRVSEEIEPYKLGVIDDSMMDKERKAMGIETTFKVLNKRLIIAVDTNTCTGCGDCVDACLTGALQLVNDKATLIDEKNCDCFGSCIAACKQDAIRLEVREAEDFD
ncbi:ATP-binding protein [Thermoproteota archaeon]